MPLMRFFAAFLFFGMALAQAADDLNAPPPILPVRENVRLKDLVTIEGVRANQLVGYGLVVGLNGTGDRQQTLFSAQSLTNLLLRMGVSVSPTLIISSDSYLWDHRPGAGGKRTGRDWNQLSLNLNR